MLIKYMKSVNVESFFWTVRLILIYTVYTKQNSYSISHEARFTWIEKWLTNRSQVVVVDGERSSDATVDSGVPQGTVLGPLLFILFINDIATNISSSIRLFADDSLTYRPLTGSCKVLPTPHHQTT